MQKKHFSFGRARVAALVVAVASAIALGAPALARADAVTTWNTYATGALIGTAAQAPPVAAIHLAMVHGAVYDAVNAIDGGHEGYLISSRLATPFDSKDAAAAAAAHRVLLSIVPAQQSVLDAQYAASLAGIPDGSSKTRGIAVGEAAAAAMIAARTEDGRFGPFRFVTGSGPGVWKPALPAFASDPNAWVKDVKPFMLRSASQFRSNGPLRLTSHKYAKEFNEVKSVGSATSTTRTDDQTFAARYWAEQPMGTWSRIVRSISAAQGLGVVDNARLFAMLYMTAADAFITVWDSKAYWSFWRPITAIREAATDDNAATVADPNWLPLIPTPPYPEEPSGHLGLSSSFVTTLQQFLGTDDVAWTDTNNGGMTRSYTHLSDALDEIVDVRVWSGIHFRTADEHSERIGQQVAKWRDRHFFKAVRYHGDDDD
jgi:hypothetical protein